MANKKKISIELAKEAFGNLFKKSVTQKYPSVPAQVADTFRGKQILNIENCIGCTLCARECPTRAIEMFDVGGKKRPMIHLDRCIFCYQCADTCPRNVFEKSKMFELASTDKSTLLMKPTIKATPAPVKPSTSSQSESTEKSNLEELKK